MVDETKTVPLDPGIADRLLDLLGTDDGFRELFQKDPLSALQKVGYDAEAEVGGSLLPFSHCCSVEKLASKEAIAAAREEIRSMLTAGLAYHTPQLDASNTDDRFTLK